MSIEKLEKLLKEFKYRKILFNTEELIKVFIDMIQTLIDHKTSKLPLKYKIVDADNETKAPEYQTDGASGIDFYLPKELKPTVKEEEVLFHSYGKFYILDPGETITIDLNITVEIPEGYEMALRPRSSLSKNGIILSLGTIDSDYRGSIGAIITNTSQCEYIIEAETRICQGIVSRVKKCELIKVEELSDTERGAGGFGSTGKG